MDFYAWRNYIWFPRDTNPMALLALYAVQFTLFPTFDVEWSDYDELFYMTLMPYVIVSDCSPMHTSILKALRW